MKFVYIMTLAFVVLAASGAWADRNGSSGVGNGKVALDRDIATGVSDSFIRVINEWVVDVHSGEPIMALGADTPLRSSQGIGTLVPSKLGEVWGYEFIPHGAVGATSGGFWLACADGALDPEETCLKLTPLSASNPKVPAVVEALQGREKPRL